jgi:CubicO group peptidase (beta-lactamase class C family)
MLDRWEIPICVITAASCALVACVTTSMHDPRVDELMSAYAGDVPGASVLVVRDGHVLHRASYGLADLEAHTAATPQTNFRLASVSKQFTAAAMAILAKRGALSYDDPITRYFPSLPAYAQRITIKQVLTHSSGLPDYEDLIPKEQTEQVSDLDVLHLIEKTDHTLFEPGSKYQYSNTGYVFLGLIVAKVSGISFPAFLKREIFDPLGMHDTVAYVRGASTIAHRAYGYTHKDGTWTRRDHSVTSATLGDGGIYSSIDDLQKWDASLSNGKPEYTVASDEGDNRYGYGWFHGQHHGYRTQWHTGSTTSFRNVIVRFPDERLTVIVLSNRDEPSPQDVALKVADLYL